jgi:hypothetical protein
VLLGAVDPGLRHTALALFDDGDLAWAGLVYNPERSERGPKAWLAMAKALLETYPLGLDRLVLETQQVYGGASAGASDLLELSGVIGCVTGLYGNVGADVVGVLPREWTGGVPKDVRHARLLQALSVEELSRVEPCAEHLRHNVLDSIALGKWYCYQLTEGAVRGLG